MYFFNQLFSVCLLLCLMFNKLNCLHDGDLDLDYGNEQSVLDHAEDPNHLDSEHVFGDIFNPMHEVIPHLQGDLTKVTWEHAVNSQEKLNKALNSTALMIEADIIFGTLKGDASKKQQPVMGHPPAIESDLSLDQFMDKIINSGSSKGMKLDFKSIEAFLKAQSVMEKYADEGTGIPIWLNADILPGPVDALATPVNADKFLNTSVHNFPDSMLSVGWTTQYAANGKYTTENIEAMTKALNRNNVLKPVTFPVRAVFAAESIDILEYLVKTSPPGSSLTVWMSNDSDPVNISKLKKLLEVVGRNKIFLDVPDFIKEKLNSNSTDPNSCSSLRNNILFTALCAVLLSAVYFH